MLTKEQIKDRVNFLGGSDIASILGLNPFCTALQTWAIKTGQIEAPDVSDKLQVRLGNKLEATVAELFQEETGKKVARVNEELVHPTYSFLRGNLDRRVVGEKAILEIKTTSPWRLKEFDGEEMPAAFIVQTVFYMALTGASVGYVAVLFGNQDFKIKTILKDPKLEADIIGKAVEFWERFVIPKVMPAATKRDADTLYSLFPNADDGIEIGLGDQANQLVEQLEAMGEDKKLLDGNIERVKNEIKAMLGEAALARTDRYTISWKNVNAKAYTVAAKSYRQLRYSEIKKGIK